MQNFKMLLVFVLCACFLFTGNFSHAMETNVKLADYVGTGKLVKGYASDETSVAWIVDDLGSGAGDEVWYYNITTGAKGKIAGSSGYTTLADDIYIIDGYAYWVVNSGAYKIYRYKLSGGTVAEYFNIFTQ